MFSLNYEVVSKKKQSVDEPWDTDCVIDGCVQHWSVCLSVCPTRQLDVRADPKYFLSRL